MNVNIALRRNNALHVCKQNTTDGNFLFYMKKQELLSATELYLIRLDQFQAMLITRHLSNHHLLLGQYWFVVIAKTKREEQVNFFHNRRQISIYLDSYFNSGRYKIFWLNQIKCVNLQVLRWPWQLQHIQPSITAAWDAWRAFGNGLKW